MKKFLWILLLLPTLCAGSDPVYWLRKFGFTTPGDTLYEWGGIGGRHTLKESFYSWGRIPWDTTVVYNLKSHKVIAEVIEDSSGDIDGKYLHKLVPDTGKTLLLDSLDVLNWYKIQGKRILDIDTGSFDYESNVFIGIGAGLINTGWRNSAVGHDALYQNTGNANNAFGRDVLRINKGGANSGFGDQSLMGCTSGGYNSGFGDATLSNDTSGSYNTAVGFNCLQTNYSGNRNTGIGVYAGSYALGSGGVYVGYSAGGEDVDSNKLYIANGGDLAHTWIYGDSTYQITVNGIKIGAGGVMFDSTSLGDADSLIFWSGANSWAIGIR